MDRWGPRTWLVIALVGMLTLFILASQTVEQITSGQHATPSLAGDLAKLVITLLLSGEGLTRLAQIWGSTNRKKNDNDK